MGQLDFLPYLLEAFGYNRKIHKDIDRLYETKKYEFYRLATKSEYYNHPIVREGDIFREEYAKKMLGILLYMQEKEDMQLLEKVLEIVCKGWPRAYIYVKNHDTINLDKYFSKIELKNDDDANTETTILFWMTLVMEKEIEQTKDLATLEQIMITRLKHYKDDNPKRFSYKTFTPDLKKNIKTLKERVYSQYGKFKTYDDLFGLHISDDLFDTREALSIICDTERISPSSLFNNVKFTERDIEEVLGSYFIFHRNKNAETAGKFLVSGLILKGLLKAYRQVKEHYFENNRETMLLEMRRQDDKIKKLSEENRILTQRVERLTEQAKAIRSKVEEKYNAQVRELESRARELERELQIEKQKDQELRALREFVFSLEAEELPDKPENIDLSGVHGLVFGGHDRWRQKMKELLPRFIFISSEGFDIKVFDGVDIVFFFAVYMSHGLYFKAINEARRRDLPVGYIRSVNEELALGEIGVMVKNMKT